MRRALALLLLALIGCGASVIATPTQSVPTSTPTPIAISIAGPGTLTLTVGSVGKATTVNSLVTTGNAVAGGSISLLEGPALTGCLVSPTTLIVAGSGSSSFESEIYGVTADLGDDLCIHTTSAIQGSYNGSQQ